jgi:hypothetical protein
MAGGLTCSDPSKIWLVDVSVSCCLLLLVVCVGGWVSGMIQKGMTCSNTSSEYRPLSG